MKNKICTINDPLYGDIRLHGAAIKIIDTPVFRRLRKIKQLGMVHEVFPTATHTRFEHPLGAYHLSGSALERMRERGELDGIGEDEVELVRLAALVHDAGHWPLAHVLEEYGYADADHERAGEAWITEGRIAEHLAATGIPDAARRIAEMIRHEGDHPLRTLVAGAVDVDRLDYLNRDAYYCGTPQAMNQNRILKYLLLRPDPATGEKTVMVDEKALVNLDQMMWQKFDLFRSVLWHRVVRSASAMGRSLLIQSIEAGIVRLDEVRGWSDEEFLLLLRTRLGPGGERVFPHIHQMLSRLEARELHSAALTLPMDSLPVMDGHQRALAEQELEQHLELPQGGALLDIPRKEGMYDLDIKIARRSGDVVHLSELGSEDGYVTGEEKAARYRASGKIRVYTSEKREIPREELDAILKSVLTATSPRTARSR